MHCAPSSSGKLEEPASLATTGCNGALHHGSAALGVVVHVSVAYPISVPPLVTMLLFTYFLVIALSLTLWSALTLVGRPGRGRRLEQEETFEPVVMPPRRTNDEVRGARASTSVSPTTSTSTPAKTSGQNDDAFERFLHAERKD